MRTPTAVLLLAATTGVVLGVERADPQTRPASPADVPSTIAMHADPNLLFKTGDQCSPCHNSLVTPSGEDVSIGTSWRATMMANSARDPYWQAAVRRETIDHPSATADIEDECSICHMPMARATAHMHGRTGQIFAHLPVTEHDGPEDQLAHDGVSCTLCHQITSERLGTRESLVGGFVIAGPQPTPRLIFGPFDIEKGLQTIMRSSAEFQPTRGLQVQSAELCATCHTLITKSLGPNGEVIGELPEQVMYQEWQHSYYAAAEWTCQTCHMPPVDEPTPISSVLGQPRDGLHRHVFVGGNFFLLRLLNRYRDDLGVIALPVELEASAARTVHNLQSQTAELTVEPPVVSGGRLEFAVSVRDLAGHKFPTGYPSRRAWLHVTVLDGGDRAVFESGAITATGLIEGNDNDVDPARFEPHYTEIRQPDQVQIYESIMGDAAGRPTTGLLTAVRYLKDNRLLPRGFDKTTADAWVKVAGGALEDDDFTAGGDRVRYSVDVGGATGPFRVHVELRFQPIGYRWAHNLEPYDAFETRRFVRYYDVMSVGASEIVATARSLADRPPARPNHRPILRG
jgi:hypothetical protein